MIVLQNLLVFRATQHINNVIHPKSFFATSHTGEKLHRLNCPVFDWFEVRQLSQVQLPLKTFAKVAQLNCATTVCAFSIVKYLT